MKEKLYRWFSSLIAVVLLILLFATTTLVSQPAAVTADIADPADVTSVDIAWNSMKFTYVAPSKGT